ncbi:TRAP transporter large permease [Anaerotruncus rubiinfantis]|uniref:TRAP transporter large permease n=1 Tax=Anaerotruncus rubiinfantis TaxID=1720200 RepID=UPI001898A378|nr:TRAP transporter large permease [Anaerotruncus rubiinfantis]
MALLGVSFVILLLLNVPIAFVVALSGVGFFLGHPEIPFSITVQRVVAQTQSYTFLAIPFFIFAGNLMNDSGITKRLLSLAKLLTRRMYGGLAQVNILMSTLMGGISGSACADASMEARIIGQDMIKAGYTKGYTTAVTCLSALITATIPPSLGLIIFGFVGGVSIGRLLVGGIIPGILMAVTLMTTVAITSKRRHFEPPIPDAKRATGKEILHAIRESLWALFFPIILIVGIRLGLFTPSEAGAFAVVYAIFIGKFVYKELHWKNFKVCLRNACVDTGVIMLIICMSGIFSYAITYVKAPAVLSEFILGITTNVYLLQLIIMLFLFVLGMFMDSDVNTLLLTPIFLPMVTSVGIDPVHFGVMMATIITVGIMTPPIGTACYIVCGILDCPLEEYIKESVPFFLAVLLEFAVLIFFPQVVLFLPNLIFG